MKISTVIIIAIVVLVVGTGAGFIAGKMSSSGGADTAKLQEAKDMMKKQSASIQSLGDMMTSAGLSMQEAEIQYKDDSLTTKGKDLVAVGKKAMEDDAKLTEKDSSMK